MKLYIEKRGKSIKQKLQESQIHLSINIIFVGLCQISESREESTRKKLNDDEAEIL